MLVLPFRSLKRSLMLCSLSYVVCLMGGHVNAATLTKGLSLEETELIILLDTKSPQKIANHPDDIHRSVTSASKTPADNALYLTLGSPLKSRYVLAERLTAEQLQRFGADSPRVLLDQFVVLTYANAQSAEVSRVTLTVNKGIANVSKNVPFYFSAMPSDPGFQSGAFGSGFMNYQWGLQQMNFPAAWDTVKGNAYVAVLDTGIQLGHPDLTANFKPQLSKILSSAGTLDDEIGATGYVTSKGHGTHVSGTIAANTNNGFGVARMLELRIVDRQVEQYS